MSEELFNTAETPFNLAGELIDNSLTAEGEARLRAEAKRQERHEQREFRMHAPDQSLTEFLRDSGH